MTSSGTQWSGVTDRVVGGKSSGILVREANFHGRAANVLKGTVVVGNTKSSSVVDTETGFIQMATKLLNNPQSTDNTVDASAFDGVELDVVSETSDGKDSEKFNVQ